MLQRVDPFSNTSILLPAWIDTRVGRQEEENKELYRAILAGTHEKKKEKREENIIALNTEQEALLGRQNAEFNSTEAHALHRKLVAYYRPTQIDYISQMQVLEIMRFLRYYVEQGYSHVFDEFILLYRFPETDIVEEFGRNSYEATGVDFRRLSSIYANTVHFSNGSPDFVPGTLPILGTTPHERWKGKGKHTHLPIRYESMERMSGRQKPLSASERARLKKLLSIQSMQGVLEATLDTITRTEKLMLGSL